MNSASSEEQAPIEIHAEQVLLGTRVHTADLKIRNGLVESIRSTPCAFDSQKPILIPGLVDTHVHVNEPGRTEWEGFETATLAAAAGGVTTLIDMPLNCSPVTTTVRALETKLEAIRGKLSIDVGFWGGVIPGNTHELAPMTKKGVHGFKCFLIHSGLDEFPHVGVADLEKALPILAELGVPLLVHAELECSHAAFGEPQRYQNFLKSRPKEWENEAVRLVIRLCEKFRARMHIVHLSSAEALGDIARAKLRGVPLTVETCPHYLYFPAEEIRDGDVRFKCTPPIREKENQRLLWQGLKDGVLDFVVSDHSPCTPELKRQGDFEKSWGGIASVQLGLGALMERAEEYDVPLPQLIHWMATAPARWLGLQDRGEIKVGARADFAWLDPKPRYRLENSQILHRNKQTPYEGHFLRGQIESTFVRGEKVFQRGQNLKRIGRSELVSHHTTLHISGHISGGTSA